MNDIKSGLAADDISKWLKNKANEIGRKKYNNARQRLLEKHKSEGLEATVETAEPI